MNLMEPGWDADDHETTPVQPPPPPHSGTQSHSGIPAHGHPATSAIGITTAVTSDKFLVCWSHAPARAEEYQGQVEIFGLN
jgi:hypothetical protein